MFQDLGPNSTRSFSRAVRPWASETCQSADQRKRQATVLDLGASDAAAPAKSSVSPMQTLAIIVPQTILILILWQPVCIQKAVVKPPKMLWK